MRVFVISLILALVGGQTAARADFQAGVAAYQAGQFVQAAQLWKTAAEAGDPAAQRNLGLLFLAGQGVKKDPTRAADLFRQSAEQSFAPAAANLADLYLRGEGVPRDLNRSLVYLRIAADGGLTDAQHNMGVYYEHGVGTDKDEDAAVFWYRRAATGGFQAAMDRLAELRPNSVPDEDEISAPPAPALTDRVQQIAGDGLVDRLITLYAPAQ